MGTTARDVVTELLADLLTWFAEPGRWSVTDPDGIPYRSLQHLWVSGVATLTAVVAGVPPALLLSHRRRAEAVATTVVNLGRAIPSFGLVVLLWLVATRLPWLGTGFWPLVLALIALALPPIFTNTYTAVRDVDPAVVESARGMGYTERQLLWVVELPLASPVISAGIRLAVVQVVATTAIGAVVTNGGGLGRYVVDGFAVGRSGRAEVLAGALLLITLTLALQGLLALLERRLLPRGVRDTPPLADVAAPASTVRSGGRTTGREGGPQNRQ